MRRCVRTDLCGVFPARLLVSRGRPTARPRPVFEVHHGDVTHLRRTLQASLRRFPPIGATAARRSAQRQLVTARGGELDAGSGGVSHQPAPQQQPVSWASGRPLPTDSKGWPGATSHVCSKARARIRSRGRRRTHDPDEELADVVLGHCLRGPNRPDAVRRRVADVVVVVAEQALEVPRPGLQQLGSVSTRILG